MIESCYVALKGLLWELHNFIQGVRYLCGFLTARELLEKGVVQLPK